VWSSPAGRDQRIGICRIGFRREMQFACKDRSSESEFKRGQIEH
jgi:hypothetical protein